MRKDRGSVDGSEKIAFDLRRGFFVLLRYRKQNMTPLKTCNIDTNRSLWDRVLVTHSIHFFCPISFEVHRSFAIRQCAEPKTKPPYFSIQRPSCSTNERTFALNQRGFCDELSTCSNSIATTTVDCLKNILNRTRNDYYAYTQSCG